MEEVVNVLGSGKLDSGEYLNLDEFLGIFLFLERWREIKIIGLRMRWEFLFKFVKWKVEKS